MIHVEQNHQDRSTNSITTPTVQVVRDKHHRPVTLSRVIPNRPSTKAITSDAGDIHSIEQKHYEQSLTYDAADMADTIDSTSSPSIDTPAPKKTTAPAIPKMKLPTKPAAPATAQKKAPPKPTTAKKADEHPLTTAADLLPAGDSSGTEPTKKPSTTTATKSKKKGDAEDTEVFTDMNGHGDESKKSSSKKKRKAVSKSKRAELVFPVGRLNRKLRQSSPVKRIGEGAPVYMAAVLEYMASEVLDLAAIQAKQDKKVNIIPKHIRMAFANDIELERLAKELDIVIPNSGVIPNASIDMVADRAKQHLIAMSKHANRESKKKSKSE
jgi:histone H2A